MDNLDLMDITYILVLIHQVVFVVEVAVVAAAAAAPAAPARHNGRGRAPTAAHGTDESRRKGAAPEVRPRDRPTPPRRGAGTADEPHGAASQQNIRGQDRQSHFSCCHFSAPVNWCT